VNSFNVTVFEKYTLLTKGQLIVININKGELIVNN